MSKWIDRILGVENLEEYSDYGEDSYFQRQQKKDMELKDKIFNPNEDLTFEEFTRLLDITTRKFKSSFGCFGTDYEIVFRKKNNQLTKKKKESGKVKDEK